MSSGCKAVRYSVLKLFSYSSPMMRNDAIRPGMKIGEKTCSSAIDHYDSYIKHRYLSKSVENKLGFSSFSRDSFSFPRLR